MSAFHVALTDFLQKLQTEEAIAAAAGDDDLGADHKAACIAGQEAFDRLFAMPAENASQAAAKLSALAAYYEVPADTGCGADSWGQLVAEVARFSVGTRMTRADDVAASATVVTSWNHVRALLAAGVPASHDDDAIEMTVLHAPASSPAGVRAKLMLALDHLVDPKLEDRASAAIRYDNLEALALHEGDLDFPARLIVSAVQALAAMSS